MRAGIVIALIAAFPPTLAAILGYFANSRSIRRSIGEPSGVPLNTVVQRLDDKVDRLTEGQAAVRERLASVEASLDSLGGQLRFEEGRTQRPLWAPGGRE